MSECLTIKNISMKKQSIFSEVLQLKITLEDSQPKIWRRILVPDNYIFFDLHCAIQNAMGWTDGHLHDFRFADKKNNWRSIKIGTPIPDDDIYDGELIDERVAKIIDYFGKFFRQAVYEYDFGDGWTHTILLEKIFPKKAREKYPQCVAGANACPPEDCGGVWGYRDLQKILNNPKHEEYAKKLEWLCIDRPEEFDPAEFLSTEVVFENPEARLVEWNEGFGLL